jgi:methylenetetrahydrofolate reductase (NADPH)
MSLKNIFATEKPISVSFEFSPPKTAEMEEQLWHCIKRLEPLGPSFVSVTYGAGGSTRDRTHATVKRMVQETTLKPAAHLTCVGSPKAEIDEIVRQYWDAGVRHIVALRGDMPGMVQPYAPHGEGYQTTPDLVRGIREAGEFEVSVSCYPEKHPESPSLEHDLDLLKKKVDAGASRAITQFCFSSETLARFRDRADRWGIRVPIVPGLMPTTNFKGIRNMSKRCGAQVPSWLAALYDGLDNDLESRRIVSSAVLAEQVSELHSYGFEQFHFYTLNQADLTYATCRILGVKETL